MDLLKEYGINTELAYTYITLDGKIFLDRDAAINYQKNLTRKNELEEELKKVRSRM
tara:strand:+ start:542 stop:709 length:168 start_codon:yes stop_codon:yes gene_type:complete